jgi:hypothetical protein
LQVRTNGAPSLSAPATVGHFSWMNLLTASASLEQADHIDLATMRMRFDAGRPVDLLHIDQTFLALRR